MAGRHTCVPQRPTSVLPAPFGPGGRDLSGLAEMSGRVAGAVSVPGMTALDDGRIRHTVVFSLAHDEGSPEEASFLEALAGLAAIDGVEGLQVLAEVSPKNDYAYGVTMEFRDRAAYAAYDAHPAHQAFVRDRWLPEVTSFLEVDFAKMPEGG